MAPTQTAVTRDPVLVDLALQGGGSHGAFTWGVLDRLLEEPWLRVDGISGTSAGAMNAAMLVMVTPKEGPTAHAQRPERISGAVSPKRRASVQFSAARLTCCSDAGRWILRQCLVAMDLMSRMFSPYDLNPLGNNPLRDDPGRRLSTLTSDRRPDQTVHYRYLCSNRPTAACFKQRRLYPGCLLASACLPTMFQAIEIDGEAYWDGGYSGNPTITPLVRQCDSQDTILVQINPIDRPGVAALCARHPQPRQRSVVQRRAAEGAAHDRLLRRVADPGHERGHAHGPECASTVSPAT